MEQLLTIENFAVLLALGLAVFSDLKTKKVDNRFVVGVFLVGILLHLILHGFSGIWSLGSSVLAAFALGLPLYMMKIFAGGDFKLLIAVSTLLDWKAIITITIASFFWGAFLGLFRVALQGDLKSVGTNLMSIFLKNKAHQAKLHVMPYTVAIFFGFLSHLTLSQVGWELI